MAMTCYLFRQIIHSYFLLEIIIGKFSMQRFFWHEPKGEQNLVEDKSYFSLGPDYVDKISFNVTSGLFHTAPFLHLPF